MAIDRRLVTHTILLEPQISVLAASLQDTVE